MGNSWKMRCVNELATEIYEVDKIYEIKDGEFLDKELKEFWNEEFESFEYFKKCSGAEWELIQDEPERKYGSWKMKCVDSKNVTDYVKNKIYQVKNGVVKGEDAVVGTFENFKEFEKCSLAKWELITEELDEAQSPDATNPIHYNDSCSLECIEAMEMAYGKYWVYVFCITNAWKYIWRYKNKNGEQDIKKARWYVDKAKSLEEGAGEWENIESVLTKIEDEKLWW